MIFTGFVGYASCALAIAGTRRTAERILAISICPIPSARTYAGGVKPCAQRLQLVEVVQAAQARALLELLHLAYQRFVERQRDIAPPPFLDHPADHVVDLGRALAHREIAPGARAHLDLVARLVGKAIQHGARLGLLGRRARPQLQRLEGAKTLELHARSERHADALADEGRQDGLVLGVAERVGERLVADRLREEQRAIDLLRPEVADDIVRYVCVHRMGKEFLDARQALGDPTVKLADPDVAETALLD